MTFSVSFPCKSKFFFGFKPSHVKPEMVLVTERERSSLVELKNVLNLKEFVLFKGFKVRCLSNVWSFLEVIVAKNLFSKHNIIDQIWCETWQT